jgi:hypothetical protein
MWTEISDLKSTYDSFILYLLAWNLIMNTVLLENWYQLISCWIYPLAFSI